MIISNKNYKLLYLDTNAIRSIVDNIDGSAKGFMERFFTEEKRYAPCFSYENATELRPNNRRYKDFLKFFSVFPCIMFYHYRLLILEENKLYNNKVDTVLNQNIIRAFSPASKNPNDEFKKFIQTLDIILKKELDQQQKDTSLIVEDWERERNEKATLFKEMKINRAKDLEKLYLACEKATIEKDLLVENITIKSNNMYKAFPSLRLMEYSLFQRLYLTKKPIKKNDVVDIKMSGFYPYVDAIITESFQANVCKKAKKHINELKDIEIYTLNDIRTK